MVGLGITDLLSHLWLSGLPSEQLSVNTRGAVHHRASSQAPSLLVLLSRYFCSSQEKDQQLMLPCPKILLKPKASVLGAAHAPAPPFDCPGINLRGKADGRMRKGRSLCLGGLHSTEMILTLHHL